MESEAGQRWQEIVLRVSQAERIRSVEKVQSLWSGYGEILRVRLVGGDIKQVVVKHVASPWESFHPRGWDTDLAHQRKLRSYDVESNWYQNWSTLCGEQCRVPRCWALERFDEGWLMVLEDLNDAGFYLRRESLGEVGMASCLEWLASFHARFLDCEPEGLWETGTYWHLETRPDEFAAMPDSSLKRSAAMLDEQLNGARFKTLVHGDAKVANFCFSEDESQVAAVDFQYVGGGCGMKDVAYFMGSCLGEAELMRREGELLDIYFAALGQAMVKYGKGALAESLEKEWRELFPVAWTDFYRFLAGWMPDHPKVHRYTESMARKVLAGGP